MENPVLRWWGSFRARLLSVEGVFALGGLLVAVGLVGALLGRADAAWNLLVGVILLGSGAVRWVQERRQRTVNNGFLRVLAAVSRHDTWWPGPNEVVERRILPWRWAFVAVATIFVLGGLLAFVLSRLGLPDGSAIPVVVVAIWSTLLWVDRHAEIR